MTPRWVLNVFVPGRAAPQGSKRHVGNGRMIESSKGVETWRNRVSWHVAQSWMRPPLVGPVRLRLEFVMPRPANAPKSRTPPAIKRPDMDKLSRAIFDALTSVCWHDDSQVVELYAVKRLAELNESPGPGVLIQIEEAV